MKYITIQKRTLLIILSVLLVFCILTTAVGITESGQVFLGKTKRKLPIYSVETDNKVVALTFDAAWGSEKTQMLLDTLKKYNVPATFFLVGFWVEKNSDFVTKMDEQGIEIGTHSNTHPSLPTLSENKIRLELETSCKAIENIVKKKVSVFRPPYGDYSDKMLNVAESLNLATIQWDIDTLDSKDLSAEQISLRVLNNVKNGSIVLMHNDGKYTLQALPLIINGLINMGYGFSTVGNLIYKDNYYIDQTGRQFLNSSM